MKGAVFLQKCGHKNTVLILRAGEGTASVFKCIAAGSTLGNMEMVTPPLGHLLKTPKGSGPGQRRK